MRGLRSGGWGDIPDDWDLVKVTRAVRIPNGLVDPTKDEFSSLRLIAPNHVESHTGRLLHWESSEDQGASSGKYLVREGDIVYSKIRPALNKVTIAPERSLCSADMYPIRPRDDLLDSRYLMYAMLSPPFLQRTVDESMRVAMPKVNRESLGAVHIPVPPLSSQRAIAGFLDRETAKIDTLIEKKQRLLKLLDEKRTALITRAVTRGLDPGVPMKESGVEWIGQIPEHWDVVPVYGAFDVQLGKMLDSKRITGEHLAPYLRNQDVQWRSINTDDLPVMDFDPADRKKYSLKPGDLLVCEGGDIGRSAVWHGEIEECYYQKALHRVRPRGAHSAEFLFYVMWAAAHRGVFEAGGNPNTITHLTATMLRNHRFPMPAPREQRHVVAVLDRHWSRTERLKARITHAVVLLNEYRTALISGAVTGSVGVNDAGEPMN